MVIFAECSTVLYVYITSTWYAFRQPTCNPNRTPNMQNKATINEINICILVLCEGGGGSDGVRNNLTLNVKGCIIYIHIVNLFNTTPLPFSPTLPSAILKSDINYWIWSWLSGTAAGVVAMSHHTPTHSPPPVAHNFNRLIYSWQLW